MEFLKKALELQNSLSAAAHLIHGSSEGRFTVTYCPGGLTQEEVEGGEMDCCCMYTRGQERVFRARRARACVVALFLLVWCWLPFFFCFV